MSDGPYRGGKVHVLATKCSTCVFRPGNKMHLDDGRLEDLVRSAVANDSTIICHKTLPEFGTGQQAACRGFFDVHKTQPLQIAERLGMIEWDPAPEGR